MTRFILIRCAADLDLAARTAAGLGRTLRIVSAPEAGIRAGAMWWKMLIDRAAARHPGIVETALLDCGESPGRTMEAIRAGVRDLAFRGGEALAVPLAQMADSAGATLWRTLPDAIDLDREKDAAEACRAVLSDDSGTDEGPAFRN
jgi:hypothetical protein